MFDWDLNTALSNQIRILVFQASELEEPFDFATTTVQVFVGDVNDNKPEFDKSVYEARVDENVEEGTTIDLKLVVTDADVEVWEQSLHFFSVAFFSLSKLYKILPVCFRSINFVFCFHSVLLGIK